MKKLVLLDTDRIHEYVFSSNKLKEIRGASALLDKLNLITTFDLLPTNKGNYKKIGNKWEHNSDITATDLEWEVIFIGGGSGKIIFKESKAAAKFCTDLEQRYKDETFGEASITSVIVDYDDSDIFLSIYHGEKELRKKKDSKKIIISPLTSHYFKACDGNGDLVAEETDGNDFVSLSIKKKREEGGKDENPFYLKFKIFLERPENLELRNKRKNEWGPVFGKKLHELFPKDLTAIGRVSNNYIGLIYADGNRMSQHLREFDKTEKYHNFSTKVRLATENSIYRAIAESLEIIKDSDGDTYFPFEILLLGGDDLILVVPADNVIHIAIKICQYFKELTIIDEVVPKGVSISAGIVITHSNYPMHLMIDYAEQLLRYAKKVSNKNPELEYNCIDFTVIKNELLKDIKTYRDEELTYMGEENILQLYNRPYIADELDELVHKILKMKESDFPRSRLKYIYQLLYKGRIQSTLEFLIILTRLKNDHRELIKNLFFKGTSLFPWIRKKDRFVTEFIDLIELYDFISKGS